MQNRFLLWSTSRPQVSTTELAKIAEVLLFTCLHTGDQSPADSTSEKLTFPTHNQKEPEGHNSKYPLSKGYGLRMCVFVWGRGELFETAHVAYSNVCVGETDIY